MSFCIGMKKVNCFYGIMEFHETGKIERLVLIYFKMSSFNSRTFVNTLTYGFPGNSSGNFIERPKQRSISNY